MRADRQLPGGCEVGHRALPPRVHHHAGEAAVQDASAIGVLDRIGLTHGNRGEPGDGVDDLELASTIRDRGDERDLHVQVPSRDAEHLL